MTIAELLNTKGGRERRVQGGEDLLRVRQSRQVRLCRVQSGRRSRCVRDYGQASAQGRG